MAYVYRHIRLDKNEPFYIGIGSDEKYQRADYKGLKGRNIYWHRIVGKTDYEVEIILDELTYEESLKKEQEFIALYGRVNNNTGILCNLTDGGEGSKGLVVSEETREKLKKAVRLPQTEEQKRKAAKANWRKVVQLDMNGNIVKVWDSLKEASSVGFKVEKVIRCARYRIRQYKGFLWKYFDNLHDGKKYIKPPVKIRALETYPRGPRHSEESKLKNKLAHAKTTLQFTKDDIFVREWVCATDAAKELGYKSQSKISDCCRGIRNQYMGFKWKYKK
jgi:hypothetical protein